MRNSVSPAGKVKRIARVEERGETACERSRSWPVDGILRFDSASLSWFRYRSMLTMTYFDVVWSRYFC